MISRFLGSVLVAALLLCSTGCRGVKLACRSEYLYPTYLASVQVNTPDPIGTCFFGQQIIVSWKIPKKCFSSPLNLVLKIRFGSRELDAISVPIAKKRGTYIYRLINQEYWCKEGIISFQASLQNAQGETLETWNHFLWAEIININPND